MKCYASIFLILIFFHAARSLHKSLEMAKIGKNLHFYPVKFIPDGVLSSLYPYVCPKFFEIFVFLGLLVVLDDFFIFWKKWFLGLSRPFFDHFSDIQGLTQGTLQVRWFMLERFCLQILNLYSGTPVPFFCFFKKSLCWPCRLSYK